MSKWLEENVFFSILLLLSITVSLRIALGLWLLPKHTKQRKIVRVMWTIISLLPILGPFLFGALYKVPTSQHGAEENWQGVGDD